MPTGHSKYPLPSYAASIWLLGDRIAVAFDIGASDDPEVRGHTVFLTLDRCSIECIEVNGKPTTEPLPRQRGWAALLSMLKERARAAATSTQDMRIGHASSPTLYAIEQALRGRTAQRYNSRGSTATTLEDLGLTEEGG